MSRVKRGVTAHARHKKVLSMAKGYRGRNNNVFRVAVEKVIDEVIAANPDNVAAYRGGKTALMGWFVGQVMKASGGKANPGMVNQLLKQKLG